MDLIKEAFAKIKEEIRLLNQDISSIRSELSIQAQKIDSLFNESYDFNRQTDKQTQNQTDFQDFSKANEILGSLDSIKKEIRLKFKRLTTQEMVVFSKLYAIEDEGAQEITYRTLSSTLVLSESSIRDYINKLIKKGIPIQKIKLNNKTILLKISPDLKNIVTLSTIIQLREL